MNRLTKLATGNPDAGRDKIYMSVAALYRSQAALLSERERMLMREILIRLSHDVEMAIRINLAEKLADDENAPLDLILLLCDDKIEVARPIILRSRRLTDEDILKFVGDASVAHQTACAERPDIGEAVTAVLAKLDAEPVLVALVRNATARISPETFATLVEKSRALAAIQEPLAHREDLPAPLATRLCGWVSEALKAHIARRHGVSSAAIAGAVDEAAQAVAAPAEPNEGSRKLVDKLHSAGQLKPGFLLRVLHQGQMDLFETAFAKVLDVDVPSMQRLLYENGPRPVALACRAVGIDRSVFPTVFSLSRQARGRPTTLAPSERSEIESVFRSFSKTDALTRLKSVEVFFAPAG